ncbi:probable RNA-binding protein EIF1AD isoform X2 [Neocloeon triangulifer]|nr:probable RNA-binding protein EIF1AD isoform X2 [Neocloeon triangulifer]XP_059479620.1 probable RNA-binding protein EIF1AD isoform X2 [Neocloeon triangulifer]
MSEATKRKHVFQELQDPDFEIAPGQEIAKVLASKGNNLHEVSSESGKTFLASMPTKYRRNVWIKRGDFVVIERIEEGVKVQGEIVRILYKDHVEQLKKDGAWPEVFSENTKLEEPSEAQSDSDSDLFVNTNRRQPVCKSSESSSDEEEESK